MKIIILIIASNDREHEEDLKCQENTWINNANHQVSVVYLRGWDKNFYYKENQTLFVPCPEEYSLILKKTILGVKYVIENFDFDVLVRSNVSTYFETHRMVNELNRRKYSNDFFGGYFDRSGQKVFENKKSFEYISGSGIFLSKRAALKLLDLNLEQYLKIADDLAIFHYLTGKGIKRIRMTRNNLHSTHLFIPTYNIRTKNSSNPKSASRRMNLIHEYFQAKNIIGKLQSYLRIQINEFHELLQKAESPFIYFKKLKVIVISFLKFKLKIQ
jgi:hypothetical protein